MMEQDFQRVYEKFKLQFFRRLMFVHAKRKKQTRMIVSFHPVLQNMKGLTVRTPAGKSIFCRLNLSAAIAAYVDFFLRNLLLTFLAAAAFTYHLLFFGMICYISSTVLTTIKHNFLPGYHISCSPA